MSDRKNMNPNTVDTLLDGMPKVVKRMIVGELANKLHDDIMTNALMAHRLFPHMEDVGLFEDDELTPEHLKGVNDEIRQTFTKMVNIFYMLSEFNENARQRLFEAGEVDEDGNFIDEDGNIIEGDPCSICGAKPGEPCKGPWAEGVHDGQTEAEDVVLSEEPSRT